MCIFTYRFLRRKYRERHSDEDPTVATEKVSPQPGASNEVPDTPVVPQNRTNVSWKWRLMLMVALALPILLETLDYTVVATAQSRIASHFNSLKLQSYIGTVYLLTSTVFLPPFASFADIFGRHWTLQLALLFFLVGSAISTGSHNMATMLAGRGVAGVGAAGLLAIVRIILTDSSSIDSVNWQQSVLFLLFAIGYCIGPFIGGELLTVSFRWIFAINLPCAGAAMVLGFLLLRGRTKGAQPSRRMPTTVDSTSKLQSFWEKVLRVDWIGAALFLAGGVLLLLALNWGSTEKWKTAKVIVCFVIGGIALIAFLIWEYVLEREDEGFSQSRLLETDPMIPLDVFRNRNICIVQLGMFVSGMVMLVMFYFVAIFFVIVSGLSPTKSGAQLIYFAPGIGGGSLISLQIIKITKQPRYAAMLGSLVITVSLGLISMGMNENKQNLVNGFLAMAGVGTGLSIAPFAVQARFSLPASRNAVVSGLTLFFRSFGGTIGLAQCSAVLNAKVNSFLADQIRSGAISGADAAAIASASSSSSLSSIDSINALPGPIQDAVREAFRQGSRYAFISLVPWAGLAFIASLFLTKITQEDRDRRAAEDLEQLEKLQNRSEETKMDSTQNTPKTDFVEGTPKVADS